MLQDDKLGAFSFKISPRICKKVYLRLPQILESILSPLESPRDVSTHINAVQSILCPLRTNYKISLISNEKGKFTYLRHTFSS